MQTNKLENIPPLTRGSHDDLNAGACVMEAVAYVAGEPWSDHPQCVCPVVAAFCRIWNDSLPNGLRDDLLRPLIPSLIGTRGAPALEQTRALMAADWACRVAAPAVLRAAGLTAQADALEQLEPVTSRAHALAAAAVAHDACAAATTSKATRCAANAAADAAEAARCAANASTAEATAAASCAACAADAACAAAAAAYVAVRPSATHDAGAVSPADVVGLIQRMIGASA